MHLMATRWRRLKVIQSQSVSLLSNLDNTLMIPISYCNGWISHSLQIKASIMLQIYLSQSLLLASAIYIYHFFLKRAGLLGWQIAGLRIVSWRIDVGSLSELPEYHFSINDYCCDLIQASAYFLLLEFPLKIFFAELAFIISRAEIFGCVSPFKVWLSSTETEKQEPHLTGRVPWPSG